MKESIRKILDKLRQDAKTLSGTTRSKRPVSVNSGARGNLVSSPTIIGQTVYRDRPQQFRSLTVTEADDPTLQNPSVIEGVFKVRVGKRSGTRRDASALVQHKYAGREYIIPRVTQQPRVFKFIAYDEGQVVGSVGLGSDVGQGLSADDRYRTEIDRLRAAGCRVCEFTHLAVHPRAASKSVLAGLFHTAYLYASKIRGYTHAVIEVNPRHVRVYVKELKFDPIGPERLNDRVNAPAVLLCVSFDTIAQSLANYAGKVPPPGAKPTLFHYGFPQEEEAGVLKRLHRLVLEAGAGANTVAT